MKRRTAPECPPEVVGVSKSRPVHANRRSFLQRAGRAAAALTVVPLSDVMRPAASWTMQVAKVSHLPSARVVDQLRSRFTFQISVDVATVEQGLAVAGAALAKGITVVEMGTPLLKNEGVSNVVPAFRKKFPEALLLADMKTMDGGTFEARAVFRACRHREPDGIHQREGCTRERRHVRRRARVCLGGAAGLAVIAGWVRTTAERPSTAARQS